MGTKFNARMFCQMLGMRIPDEDVQKDYRMFQQIHVRRRLPWAIGLLLVICILISLITGAVFLDFIEETFIHQKSVLAF